MNRSVLVIQGFVTSNIIRKNEESAQIFNSIQSTYSCNRAELIKIIKYMNDNVIHVGKTNTLGIPIGANHHMTQNDYNGWKNRETWLVSLRLNNDYDLYQMVQSKIQEYLDASMSYDEAYNDLWDYLQEFVQEQVDETLSSIPDCLAGDLLSNNVCDRIDWDEVITSELEEYKTRLSEVEA